MTKEFIKRRPARSSFGAKELFAHEHMAPLMREPLTPQLLSHRVVEEERVFTTVDVSASHRCPGSPNPEINESELITIIETYARLHATFWGQTDGWREFIQQNAALNVSHEATESETISACERTFRETSLPQKRTDWGDTFLPEWDEQLPAIISRWAKRFTQRCESRTALTLIQGDAHLGNVMIPRDPNQASPLLVDWEGICIGIGAWDIARLLHHANFDNTTLVKFEALALENYHRALHDYGVHDFGQDDLLNDYRLSILAYVPHSLAWGNSDSMKSALAALRRWE